jgi:dihydroflavonol-4-reductase
LLGQGRPVLALCRDAGALQEQPALRVAAGDLERPDSYAPLLSAEVTVFHLAAARNAPGTPAARVRRVNLEACLELARRAGQARVRRFVHVSAALAFGPSRAAPRAEADGYWDEATAPYPASRVESQRRLMAMAAAGLPLVTVFPTIVFGPDEPRHPNRIASHLRRLLRTGLDLVVDGGGARRDLVHVADVVRGILAAERLGAQGGEYILGGEDVSARELNALALRLAGKRARASVSIPRAVALGAARVADRLRGNHPGLGYQEAVRTLLREWRFSSRRAQDALGYQAAPLQQAVHETLRGL